MKVTNTNIHATKIVLHDNALASGDFKIDPQYYKRITKLENDTYKLTLAIEILNSEEKPFPLDIIVEFESTFKFEDIELENDIKNFLDINAIQMIFPFMRSALNSVVSASIMPPLVLPIIDVRQFKERDRKSVV